MRKIFALSIALSLCMVLIFSICTFAVSSVETSEASTEGVNTGASVVSCIPLEIEPQIIIEESIEKEELLPEEDIELIALVTMAEAEGECEEGKRLVIDTILNRMDSEHFPDSAYDVIYQPNQFSSMWNGRVERCEVRKEICQLVREELDSRLNHQVMFFTAGDYGKYGVPMFQVENHYFSSYD